MRRTWSIHALCLVAAACGDNVSPNRLPDLSSFDLVTAEDTPVSQELDLTDPDGNTVTLAVSNPAVHGDVSITGATITYTPEANYNGADMFFLAVSDGLDSLELLVDVTVTAVNDAPVGAADAIAGAEDQTSTVAQAALLANDTDIDGDTLTVVSVENATHGAVAIVGTDVTFTPDANFNGMASFEYTLSDGTAMATATVSVNVDPQNDPPVAVDDTATTDEDTPLDITTLADNDTDPDTATLSVTAVANAVNGTVALVGGTVTFTPDADFNGTATFEYTVSDGIATDTGTVTVTVNPVNDAPVAVDDARTVAEDTVLISSDLADNDTDVDGDTLVVTAVANAVNGTVSVDTGTVTFTPDAGFVGTASFDYVVSDGTDTDVGTVTVIVTATPICGDGVITAPETCDDHNTDSGDGCDGTSCTTETGFDCTGEPSTCTPICGDGNQVAGEACDDGNTDDADGCTTQCVVGVVCDVADFTGASRVVVDPATGHCYVGFDGAAETWQTAETACEGLGGHLPTVTSSGENDVVHAATGATDQPWLGGNDLASEGTFVWVTGEPFAFDNFEPGQPDDDVGVGGNADCLHMFSSATWNDTNCDFDGFVVGRVCEIEVEACGDGVLQTGLGEECDDGNTIDGDGCSSTCTFENLVRFSFTGAAGDEATFAADAATPGLLAIPQMSRGAGVTPSPAANTFSGSAWTTNATIDTTDFYSFTVTPDAGFSMSLQTLELDERRSGTGIRTWVVRSSLDGFTADLATFAVPDDTNTRTNQRVVLPAAFLNLTAAIEFRIFGFAAESSAGTWRIDNVELFGFVAPP